MDSRKNYTEIPLPFFLAFATVLGALIYSNTFHAAFQVDDYPTILENPIIRNLDVRRLLGAFNTRFVTGFTFALNYTFGRYDVYGYHVLNVVVHIVSSGLVYFFVVLTFKTPVLERNTMASHERSLAMISSLIFLTHPIQTEAVTYIWQRCTSLATMFYLASLVLYIRARLGRTTIAYVGSFLCAVVAMFTKEITITLPITIGIYEFFFFGPPKRDTKKRVVLLLPFLLTLFIIPCVMMTAGDSKLALLKPKIGGIDAARTGFEHLSRFVGDDIMPRKEYVLTQFRVMWTYIRLLFLPIHQNLLYEYNSSFSIAEPKIIFSFSGILAVLIAACFLIKKHRLAAFGIFWFFLSLSPESLIPQPAVIYEHRLYLPLVGFAIFAPCILLLLLKKPRRVVIASMFVLLLFSVATYQRNAVWGTEISLWQDVVKKSPHLATAYFNLAMAFHSAGERDRSIELLKKAIALDPSYANARHNLGIMLKKEREAKQPV